MTRSHPYRLAAAVLLATFMLPAFGADITILNNDDAGVGFNDDTTVEPVGDNPETTLGDQRLFAVEFAADIWSALLESPVEIVVQTQWVDDLTCESDSATLGTAAPINIHANFPNRPVDDTWYPAALADSLAGSDLNDADPEIDLNINIELDDGSSDCLGGATWYYGVDGNVPSGQVDIVPLVLHELGHGLGFTTFVNLSDGTLPQGMPDIYMRHIRDTETGQGWLDMSDTERVDSAINDPDVVWTGTAVDAMAASFVTESAAFSDGLLRLHAPEPLEQGSSIAHWTSDASPDLLMEPSLSGSLFDQVDLTLDLFADIGWTTDVIFADGFESSQ